MSYVYRLAGEDLDLARADLEGYLRSQGIPETPEVRERVAVTSSEPERLRRLALTHEVGELVFRGDIEEFDGETAKDSFKVRAEVYEGSDMEKSTVEETLGERLVSEGSEVELEDPEETFRAYVFLDEIIVAREIIDIDRSVFEDRSNEKRPFSSPVSLDPVLARAMVNMSEVPAGGYILDPFCGTGGVLIEAGLCGIGVRGSDISEEMVNGCKRNLEKYGVINHDIRQLEVSDSIQSFEETDAIVTDLPYGKASQKEGDAEEKFLEVIESFEGSVVFCYNEPSLGRHSHDHEVYVHSNLSRYIFVIYGADR